MPLLPDPATSPPTPAFAAPSRHGEVIPVSELNRRARQLLEANLELLWVGGELSNVVRAASGHFYFSLKDATAQVRCVLFRQKAAGIGFAPENGLQVEVRALPSLYEPRGDFQLGVETMRRAGLGALYEAFERLKAGLQREGLFATERKRPLPFFPRAIGVVTSLKAAALRDVLTTLRRRAPMIDIVIYPTAVQGAGAPAEIAAAIDAARMRNEVEVLILCRGGGSIEDLWAFNDESVARAIVRLQDAGGIPVVTGIGHETDFTICDFVADQRAPTPTAAAEMASPDVDDLGARLAGLRQSLVRAARRRLDQATQRLDQLARGLVSPQQRLARDAERLRELGRRNRQALRNSLDGARFRATLVAQRLTARRPDLSGHRATLTIRRTALTQALAQNLADSATQVANARRALTHLDPSRVLERGYSIVSHRGAVLREATAVGQGESIRVQLARGHLEAQVTEVGKND